LAADLSYSSLLSTENAVDGKTYAFDIVVGDNNKPLDTLGSTNLSYVVGSMFGAKFMSNLSFLNGDSVLVEGTNYKAFKVNPGSTSNQRDTILSSLLIEW
jgi:hypothetical protein